MKAEESTTSRECFSEMSRILGSMSVYEVRFRVLRLSMTLSMVSGKVVKKKEPLTLLDSKIGFMATATVCVDD